MICCSLAPFLSLPQLLSDVSLLALSASPPSLPPSLPGLMGKRLVSEVEEIEALFHLILLKRMTTGAKRTDSIFQCQH